MNFWLRDENGKPSASLTFLTLCVVVPLTMWVASVSGFTVREVTGETFLAIAGFGGGLYAARKGQKGGWGTSAALAQKNEEPPA